MTKEISIAQLAKKYNIIASKALGQNFIFDLNITDKIVKYAGDLSNYHIIEIGPGTGALTVSILNKKPKYYTSIEFDQKFMPLQEEIFSYFEDVEKNIINDDALRIDLAKIAQDKIKIIANLPYNIATPLLISWLKISDKIESITIMIQKEVADRIVAKPNTKSYGRLSVMSQWLCEVEYNFTVSPQVFNPPPKIDSSVITLYPKKNLENIDKFNEFENFIKVAFSQRRKMLKKNLKTLCNNPEFILSQAGIESNVRAEDLSIADFIKLFALL